MVTKNQLTTKYHSTTIPPTLNNHSNLTDYSVTIINSLPYFKTY